MSGVNGELLQKIIIISLYYEYVHVFQDTFVKIILFLNYFNKATNMNSAMLKYTGSFSHRYYYLPAKYNYQLSHSPHKNALLKTLETY